MSARTEGGRRTLSRRALLRLLAATAVSACTGAPAGRAGPSPAGPETVHLVYQDWRTEWFPPMARHMLDRFRDDHPHIEVFFTPDPPDLGVQMVADMQAGTAPDVFQGCCTHFPAWAQVGQVLDLRAYVQENVDRRTVEDWDHAQYRALFAPEGIQFGLPKYHGALALYYNKDLFDEYGVGYPDGGWDHDAYADAMAHVTDDRSGNDETDLWGSFLEVTWDRIQVHVNGWGGHLVDPTDSSRLMLCEEPAIAALEWVRSQMWDNGTMARPVDVRLLSTSGAFIDGRVSMVEDGSWALRSILSAADFRIGVAPFPSGPEGPVTLASSDGFGIYAGTRYRDASWELMEFLIGQEYGRAMIHAGLLQPARASLVEEWGEYVSSAFEGKIESQDIAAFAEGHVRGYSVTAEIADNMANVRSIVDQAWEEILILGQEPVSRMQVACEDVPNADA